MTKPPLIVDLDGTLLKIDTLHEGAVGLASRHPLQFLGAIRLLLTQGKAAMKARIADMAILDYATLPVREDFVAWLQQEAQLGREIHLVSAADQRIVAGIAERIGLFATSTGSDGVRNLAAGNKRDYLLSAFPQGFSYAGDSHADIAVWSGAQSIILVGAAGSVRRRAERLGRPIEARFDGDGRPWRSFLKQLRLHQWSKNLLVFMPLLLAHRFGDAATWLSAFAAFLALSLAASATYIVNDLLDLAADRAHHSKRFRPLASGAFAVRHAMVAVPLGLLIAFGLALSTGWLATFVLAAYVVLTLSYSLRLKRIALLDTSVLGFLFTLRIVLGGAAIDQPPSFWLLAFSMMLFFALSTAKRQTEIMKKINSAGASQVAGRGYQVTDANLTLAYGISASIASLVILMLYTTNDVAQELYRHSEWLWAIPLFLHLWQMRIWLLAHRGTLNDDPIVFAIKDKLSLLLGAGCAVAFYLAL